MQQRIQPGDHERPLIGRRGARASRWAALLALALPLVAPAGCSCLIEPATFDGGDETPGDGGEPDAQPDDGGPQPDDGGPNPEPQPDDGGPNPEPQPDDGGPNPEPQPDDGGPNPEPQPDDGGPNPEPQPDDGGPNPEPQPDDGGPTPEPEPDDGGPGNRPPLIEAAPDDLQVPVSSEVELTVIASDPDDDALTYSMAFSPAPPLGLTISPASNQTGVFLLRVAPTASFETSDVTVQVSDENGGIASASFTVTVIQGNAPPVVSAGPAVGLLPGETAGLSGSASDPNAGDVVSVAWSIQGNAPTGVTFSNPSSVNTSIVVNRSQYVRPAGTSATLLTAVLTATDSAGASASATTTVRIQDERGRYVDQSSPYAGTGPNGECGHPRHPCNNLQDAFANVVGAIADGANPNQTGNTLHVAIATEPMTLDATVTTGEGIGIECGFSPEDVDQNGQWNRTPSTNNVFTFSSAIGLSVTGPIDQPLVLIDRCEFVGLGTNTQSIAIDSDAAMVLQDVVAIATDNSGVETAFGLRLQDTGQPTTINGGHFEGGIAQNKAAGITADNATLTLTDVSLLGGAALVAIGAEVIASPQPVTLTDVTATGGQGRDDEGAAGIALAASDATVTRGVFQGCDLIDIDSIGNVSSCTGIAIGNSAVTIDEVIAFGNEAPTFPASAAFGIVATASILSTSNSLMTGGPAPANALTDSLAVGVVAADTTWTSAADALVGGTFAELAAGASLNNGSSATFTDTNATGADGVPAPLGATGVVVGAASALVATDGRFSGGTAASLSAGILTAERNGNSAGAQVVNISGSEINGGQADQSYGIFSRSGELRVGNDARVEAFDAGTASYGIFAQCNIGGVACGLGDSQPIAIDNTSVFSGAVDAAAGISAAIAIFNVPESISLSSTGAFAGAAEGTTGRSYGIAIEAAETQGLNIDDVQAYSDAAGLESVGININNIGKGRCIDCVIADSHAEGDVAALDAGLIIGGRAARARLTDNAFVAEDFFGTPSFSIALSIDGGCDGCSIARNVMLANSGSVLSSGFSFNEPNLSFSIDGTSMVYSNVTIAGSAPTTIGMRVIGDSGGKLRILHNTVYGGDASGTSSVVRVGFGFTGNIGVREAALFGGNQLTLGTAPDVVGFHEECHAGNITDGLTQVARATDNNFFVDNLSADDPTLVRRTEISLINGCTTEDLTDIDDVNQGGIFNPYRAIGGGCDSENIVEDPEFLNPSDVTDPHIGDGSPLRGSAPMTFGCNLQPFAPFWNRAESMVDFDGQTRPIQGDVADIGADEID